MKSGSHRGAEVNTAITMRFTLENVTGPDETKFGSSVALLKNFVNVVDDSNMGLLEWIGSIFSSAYYLVAGAPDWKRNMFTQNLALIYTPTYTTCKLDNPGLTVSLPEVGISSLTAGSRIGYTPFNLNFSCDNLRGMGSRTAWLTFSSLVLTWALGIPIWLINAPCSARSRNHAGCCKQPIGARDIFTIIDGTRTSDFDSQIATRYL
ncbi:hypothetical protein C6Y56_14475 [Pseudomonas fluorescens]|uniref:Uncharacterized protein n=2 Tax=Pseudomonas fluorescens TaxID=294 RepID=A0A7Z3C5J1_PSEFL|nr:hypothetical protein C6Y56_14475 [Pseudomonas fluorescens]